MYQPTKQPTLHFIGVSTAASSMMRIFPEWAKFLGLEHCRLAGMDFPLHAPAEHYAEAVAFIKNDPLSIGALVTTHKLDLLRASRHLFDNLSSEAHLLQEVSCISKREGRLLGKAVDMQTSILALEKIVGPDYWKNNQQAALICLGAGGANVALTAALLQRGENCPALIRITDIKRERLQAIEAIHKKIDHQKKLSYHLVQHSSETDNIVSSASAGSLIANGTGMGKDLPGSPITEQAQFPLNGHVWDFNYRGERLFLEQAKVQKESSHLNIQDGWVYFIYGWSQVIREVFDIEVPTSGPVLEQLSSIAAAFR